MAEPGQIERVEEGAQKRLRPTWQAIAAWIAMGAAALSAIAGGGYWLYESRSPVRGVEIVMPTPAPIVVHAVGEVMRPGLYELPTGSRVQDLVKAAGGASGSADLGALNLARALLDGERIEVPRLGESEAVASTGGAANPTTQAGGTSTGLLDLNTATKSELETLPNIGSARSDLIITYRRDFGRIERVDDLLQISGIGPATVEAIRPLVVQP